MSSVTRTAGIAGTFSYTLSTPPAQAPRLTIYSDPARTVLVTPETVTLATANPVVWTASYPATLTAGTYYLTFSTVVTTGQPPVVDTDDTLVLVTVTGDVTTSYATLDEARSYGIAATEVDDDELLRLLEVSSRYVDAITGTTFVPQAQSTVTLTDVRSGMVPLPQPFDSITEVLVDGVAVTDYEVVPWGIRLYASWRDPDGWIRPRTWARSRYGATVKVTGTFGYLEVPASVRQATLLLADSLRLTERDIKSLSVEGYSVTYSDSATSDAEQLLAPYKRVLVG